MWGWLKNLLGLGPRVPRIGAKEAYEKMKAGALMIDVRTPLERKLAKIPGSQGLPLAELARRWESLPKDRPIICQCESGNRSQQAAEFLASKGFEVYNLAGGLSAWQAAGLPVKKGDLQR
ncbi:MAG: rhodanese-like domain-containing protein [Meiothermus sp.]|uniref:rhodanese-like domain-containing protein n=1 Tax=Meiothermus sp. TaxID=1955249 RepID=UPI0025E250FC|nr:rhodanese-like domain-containing protein [Meiothermus sp.]MCS7058831.1 rhodanese-like domain-containing protein [Meiothermus sp.]MCS7194069.1 rhodanese-like domain-containing protein [Meiothermus sp.]MCX7740440.1 rhodanese-like domain-containing protein [Meiothermus sp.]MDW8091156.1 rhodanese-like domain-containing protein [Meiothermus sp.]MDW8480468.1 rhodanese-like domain-containing protein [Meiothermus sp.]